jgi:hypothetical protein
VSELEQFCIYVKSEASICLPSSTKWQKPPGYLS